MYKSSDFTKSSYKPGEAAALLGVTVKTIQNYDKEGRLKVHRTSTNRRVIMRDDLMAYLDEQGMLLRDETGERQDVVYARVDDGDGSTARLDQQALEALQSAQEIMRLLILKDVGSARDDNRPAYRKLLAMVRDGRVRHVYVVSEDIQIGRAHV